MGDAAGIGPELIVKALQQPVTWELCRPLVIGDPSVMAQIAAVLAAPLAFHPVGSVAEAAFAPPSVAVLCPPSVQLGQVQFGQLSAANAQAAADCLALAYRMAMAGEVQGIVAAPMNKEGFHLAGYTYADELGIIGEATGSDQGCMMGVMGPLLTVTAAEHVAFKDILQWVTPKRILWCIHTMHAALVRADPAKARIAVAALNVHAGEGGIYGREEIDAIAPAIAAARAEGLDVSGPVPADIVFPRALGGEFDGVVCMHHDQANIARKLQPWERSATLYGGLPVFGGTTAHGTAYDKAGKGISDPGSFLAALRTVARLGGVTEAMT
jgi:4-hydroxythreonine-4-phosphate dehydrogenase